MAITVTTETYLETAESWLARWSSLAPICEAWDTKDAFGRLEQEVFRSLLGFALMGSLPSRIYVPPPDWDLICGHDYSCGVSMFGVPVAPMPGAGAVI